MRPGAGNGEAPRTNVNDGAVRPRGLGLHLVLAAAIVLAATPTAIAQDTTPLALTSTPLAPPPNDVSLGRLTWMGGLVLRAPGKRFGGLSALLISPGGGQATALSDQGDWLSFPLRHDGDGRLIGVGAGQIARLSGPDAQALRGKRNKDAEALARMADGSFAVAFERDHRIWKYASLSGAATPLAAPPGLALLGANRGIEALSELDRGGLLAIAEGSKKATESPAFLYRQDRWHALSYHHDRGFRPSGAARLPNGDILVVERFFTVLEGVRIRLVRVPGKAVRPGARLSGETLATLTPPLPLDNMEGLAARQGAKGETLIYLISDDNFNSLQRTLLMLFTLRD